MQGRDIIVIGASAGGIDPLRRIAAGLTPALPAAVFVVIHTVPSHRSALPEILSRAGPLTATLATDGEAIRHGRIYVAPPDYHLVLTPEGIRIWLGPRENWSRPSIDVLFRSAAESFGPRVVGVTLSGVLHDGTLGLMRVKAHGGVVIVQDPDETLYPTMALTALQHVDVDHVVTAVQIPRLLTELASTIPAMSGSSDAATALAWQQDQERQGEDTTVSLGTSLGTVAAAVGHASGFVCPECNGSLWEAFEGGLVHYHCHVGHVFSAENLLLGQGSTIERNLWSAVRTLQEQAALLLRTAERSRRSGDEGTARRLELRAQQVEAKGNRVREVLDEVLMAEPHDAETFETVANEQATVSTSRERR